MVITKRGKYPPWVGACAVCGTEIECENAEVKWKDDGADDPHTPHVCCPVCYSTIFVAERSGE